MRRAKYPDSVVVHRRNRLTRIARPHIALPRTLCIHVVPEVDIEKLLIRRAAPMLLLVVAVSEVVAHTGFEDWQTISAQARGNR